MSTRVTQAIRWPFTTIGLAIARLANPGAVTFLRINADNTITARSAAELRTDLGLFTAVAKTANQSKTSDTSLANDNTLLFAMVAGGIYSFRARVPFTANTAGDIKFRHTGPASPTSVAISRRTIAPGATANGNIATDAAYSGADIVADGGTGTGYFYIDGQITNGINAGDFAIQWAQNSSSLNPTVVLAGAYIEYMRVG